MQNSFSAAERNPSILNKLRNRVEKKMWDTYLSRPFYSNLCWKLLVYVIDPICDYQEKQRRKNSFQKYED